MARRVNEFFHEQDLPPRFISQTSAQQMIRDPKLYTTSVAPQKPTPPEEKNNYKPVVMRVPICCCDCAEAIDCAITGLTGVKNVACDIDLEKVTVTGTATLADVLSAARKLFKHAELWY